MNYPNYDLSFYAYQREAVKTAIYPDEFETVYPAIGLANEAGEVLGVVKKVMRDNHGVWNDNALNMLKKELGDVLWYFALVCEDAALDIELVAKENLAKLRDRQERGVLGGSGDNR